MLTNWRAEASLPSDANGPIFPYNTEWAEFYDGIVTHTIMLCVSSNLMRA